jgi:hypothetical protein
VTGDLSEYLFRSIRAVRLNGRLGFETGGSSGSFRFAYNADQKLGSTFTLAVWTKVNALSGNSYVVTNYQNRSTILWGYVANSYEFYTSTYTGDNPRTGSAIAVSDTEWHHIAYTYDGTTWSGYLDGSVVFSGGASFTLTEGTSVFIIMSANGSVAPFNGAVDDIRIYDRGLTAGEIGEIYNPSTRWELFRQDTPYGQLFTTTMGGVAIPRNPVTFLGRHGTI